MDNMKGIIYGAVIGTLLGSVGALLTPDQRQELLSRMSDKTKGLTDNFLEIKRWMQPKKESHTPDFLKGMLCGLFLGAGPALLLTPSSGKQMRKNLTKGYLNASGKTQNMMNFLNNFKKNARSTTRRKAAVRKTVRRKAKAVR